MHKEKLGSADASKHSEDIQTENRSFMQVKPPFNFLTCKEQTGKAQRQKKTKNKTLCTLKKSQSKTYQQLSDTETHTTQGLL